MVWAGILTHRRTELHIVHGNTNAINFRENVLQPIVLPIANLMGAGFILMDDNARPHRAMIIATVLMANHIERMEWPAISPDLNPIENI